MSRRPTVIVGLRATAIAAVAITVAAIALTQASIARAAGPGTKVWPPPGGLRSYTHADGTGDNELSSYYVAPGDESSDTDGTGSARRRHRSTTRGGRTGSPTGSWRSPAKAARGCH